MTKQCCPLARFDKPGSFHYVCNDPDKCMGCGEVVNNRAVLASIKCKCMAPKMPRSLRDRDGDDRPSPQVRYGN